MPVPPFTLIKSHNVGSIAAGTVVTFHVDFTKPGGGPTKAEDFHCHWDIYGPFSSEVRSFDGEPVLDWDTQGLRAGAYTVTATLRSKADQPAGEEPHHTESDVGHSILHPVPEGSHPFPTTSGAGGGEARSRSTSVFLTAGPGVPSGDVVPVSLQRTSMVPTVDQILWVIIRNRTNAVSFRRYTQFVNKVMCGSGQPNAEAAHVVAYRGAQAYDVLKEATDSFLLHESGTIKPGGFGVLDPTEADTALAAEFDDPSRSLSIGLEERRRLGRTITSAELSQLRQNYYEDLNGDRSVVLPYMRIIRDRLAEIPLKPPEVLPGSCYGILRSRVSGPLAMELIWSYWMEEGMLVQTLNAILARFQNRKLRDGVDPLARLDLDPLRPLSNLFWGWAQEDLHRLTVRRRSFEYEHEYGLKLIGKAVPDGATADGRSKFLESFHNLLFLCHVFFKEDDDTTIIADGFPVLNALRETHLLLAEGAHNQFGDLPSTARSEMLIMQWLLARPEMREFLGGRIMVPYEEEWMDRVDTMKSMQGWTDVTITHFRDMGVFGEQILLSVRYGNWSVANDPQEAANWARYWRPEIQRYTHAYRSATGVDLTERTDSTMPSLLLRRRLVTQRRAQ